MVTFDELIADIGSRYCLGDKAHPFVQETLGLISGQPGGMDQFLDRFKAAGFAVEVGSWLGPDPVPLSGEEVEKALGSDVISEIANKVDINQSFARTILGDAIPKIILLLTQGAAAPSAVPAPASNFLDSAIPLASSPVEEIAEPGALQIRPGATERFGAAPRKEPPRFKQLFAYGLYAALAVCFFGFAWAAGSYYSGGQLPFFAIEPQTSVERTEMLRTAQKTAADVQALRSDVEALRAAQSQPGQDAAALEGLKTRIEAVKTETSASIAELAGKVENIDREPAAKLSQVIERLDRIERQIAAPTATASLGAASAPGAAAKPPLGNAEGQKKMGGRGDAFDPSQNPTAPGIPRPLGSPASASTPQLITNWVVRDAYNGIALVESAHGSIEVAPGEIVPGAGTVKSIERRGSGWIVITSRGLIDSARDRF